MCPSWQWTGAEWHLHFLCLRFDCISEPTNAPYRNRPHKGFAPRWGTMCGLRNPSSGIKQRLVCACAFKSVQDSVCLWHLDTHVALFMLDWSLWIMYSSTWASVGMHFIEQLSASSPLLMIGFSLLNLPLSLSSALLSLSDSFLALSSLLLFSPSLPGEPINLPWLPVISSIYWLVVYQHGATDKNTWDLSLTDLQGKGDRCLDKHMLLYLYKQQCSDSFDGTEVDWKCWICCC